MTTAPETSARGTITDAVLAVVKATLDRYLRSSPLHRRRGEAARFGPSEDEVNALLGVKALAPDAGATEAAPANDSAAWLATVAALQQRLAEEPASRWSRLGKAFPLGDLDLVIVAMLAGPELDHALERAYAYAVNDFTRKRVDVGFLARLIGGPDRPLIDAVLERVLDDAPLRRHGVVTVAGDASAPLALRTVALADRVLQHLRGVDALDESVRGFCRMERAPLALDQLVMRADVVEQAQRVLLAPAPRPPRLLLAGKDGTGRAALVEALCARERVPCLRIDLAALVDEPRLIADRMRAALREVSLIGAMPILEGDAAIANEPPRALVDAVRAASATLGLPLVFVLPSRPVWLAQTIHDLVELDVPTPSFSERRVLWKQALGAAAGDDADIDAVAGRYGFPGAAIVHTARRATTAARLRGGEAAQVSLAELGDAARLMFSNRLGSLAQRIPTGFRWDDLVLPADTMDAVQEVVRFARQRAYLLEQWGFAQKLPYGRGVSAILAGPPGTGKTMVAQLLAGELGYDLYRIDLSQVVNKYVGETEKNLAKIFEEAEASHAVLFFDEADSLFSKRTEVKSSNDRYANLEVNYLLQRMETFDGVTLLATNLEQGLDEAFKRRVRFSVQFEVPDEQVRARLWRSMFPKETPLAPDIDWNRVAKGFEMSGGYIKKAALRAAMNAAEARRPLTTDDLLRAARLEYREMGRIVAG